MINNQTKLLKDISDTETVSDLFYLLIWTILGLVISQSILAWDIDIALTAIKFLGVVLLVLGTGACVYRLSQNMGVVILVMISYLVLVVVVSSQWMLLPLLIGSFIAFYGLLKSGSFRQLFDFNLIFASAISTLFILGIGHAENFLVIERLSLGMVAMDTLFHAGIASMIKNYLTISTGVHGLFETPYHVLSHALFAAFSILSGNSVLESYGYIQLILFDPLLVFSFAWLVSFLRSPCELKESYRIWVATCIMLLLVELLPLEIWRFMDYWWVSESFCLSLVILLLTLPYLMVSELNTRNFVLVSLLVLTIALVKSSTGLIVLGLVWLRLVFYASKNEKRKLFIPLVLTTSFVYYVLSGVAVANAGLFSVDKAPFSFVYNSFMGNDIMRLIGYLFGHNDIDLFDLFKAFFAISSFFLIHFFVSWFVVLRNIWVEGFTSIFKNLATLYSVGGLGGGIIMIAVFDFPLVNNMSFFTTVPFFVSAPILLVWGLNNYLTLSEKIMLKPALIGRLSLLVIFGSLSVFHNSTYGKSFLAYRDVPARSFIQNFVSIQKLPEKDNLVLELMSLKKAYANQTHLVFDRSIISTSVSNYDCKARPFLYPAITEHPWIGLIEENRNCDHRQYQDYLYPVYFSKEKQLLPPVVPETMQVLDK